MNSSFARAARQIGLGASVFLCLGALVWVFGRAKPFLEPRFEAAPDTNEKQRRARDSAGYDSLARSLEKLDAQTLRQWVNAFSETPNAISNTSRPAPQVAPDARAWARMHPAWLLAARLENGAVNPSSLREIRVFRRDFGAISLANPASSDGDSGAISERNLNRAIGARRLRVSSEIEGASRAQSGALDAFNRDWATRQNAIRRADEAARERELEDQIREQARAQVQLIALQTVPPDVALELANLRLQLLRTLALSPLQREQARAKINEIEERLNEIWRQQTAQQERILIESLEISPARLRREGVERIRAEIAALAARDLAQRSALIGEIERLVERDFSARDSTAVRARVSHRALELFLPPAILPRALSPTFFEQLRARGASGESVWQAEALPPLRELDEQQLAQVGSVSRAQIELLRALALRDARLWTQALALENQSAD